MPYKSEKIRLPEALDRRRRLSDADPAITGYLNGVIRVYHDTDLEAGSCIIAFKGNILQGETGIKLVL